MSQELTSKLLEAINKYLSADTPRKLVARKGQITKIINEIGSRKQVLAVLEQVKTVPDWLEKRLKTNSLYTEGGCVFGWYEDPETQVQAKELPLSHSHDNYVVTTYRHEGLWRQRGFYEAVSLPVVWYSDVIEVRFPVKGTLYWLRYGYALPCPLQWHRGESSEYKCFVLWVNRSIINHGFWAAYKWWEGCQLWYYERHPEWFADLDWWGEYESPLPRFSPTDDPYAAVLGDVHR